MAHAAAQLTHPRNLVPDRPGRSAPRARKRGGSNRYPRRKDTTPPTRTVTYRIVLHLLKPTPNPP